MKKWLITRYPPHLAPVNDPDDQLAGTPWAGTPPGLSSLGVLLVTPSKYALRQRVDVGGGYLHRCCLAHQRVDCCFRVLPGEPAVLCSPDELCNRFA